MHRPPWPGSAQIPPPEDSKIPSATPVMSVLAPARAGAMLATAIEIATRVMQRRFTIQMGRCREHPATPEGAGA